MATSPEKYINIFTDFGFKKLFGSEPSKDLLIDFLNELLKGRKHIKDLQYKKNEQIGSVETDRTAIFDLYCENEDRDKFIIELQKVKQQYFKDRSLYYTTFAIQEQAPKSQHWNYQLQEVYTIAIMDFAFEQISENNFKHEIKLIETQSQQIFYDKLTFIYLEMPKFNKKEGELETHFDKWMYLIKHLHKFQNQPAVLQEKIFRKIFDIAEIAKFTPEEMVHYKESLKAYRDYKNSLDTAIKEGREEQKILIAKKMKAKGHPENEIAEITGLSIDQIRDL